MQECVCGTWDRDQLHATKECVFGCGSQVPENGICPACLDHSVNVVVCNDCGHTLEENYDGTFFIQA
jgi:hypothetical protein